MQPPSPSRPGTYQLASIADAARLLNISETTARRMVKSGRLEAERVERPQGHVWMVKVPAPATDQVTSRHHPGAVAGGQPAAPQALTVWMSSVLEPVMAELSLSRQQLVSQAETIGRQAAELNTLRASHSPVRAHWRRWWSLAMVVGAVLVLAVWWLVPR